MKYHNTWSRANHSSSMLHFLILFKKVYPHGTKNRSTLWWPCSFTPPEGTTSPSLNLNLLNILATHEILCYFTGKFYLVGCTQHLLVVLMLLVPFYYSGTFHPGVLTDPEFYRWPETHRLPQHGWGPVSPKWEELNTVLGKFQIQDIPHMVRNSL